LQRRYKSDIILLMKYSTVILTRNEQEHIEHTIRNVEDISNEIIIVDDYSDDETTQIASDMGAKIFQRNLNDNWAEQRNFALEQVQSPWTLVIDADERLNPILSQEFANFIPRSIARAIQVSRLNFYQNRQLLHSPYLPDMQIRGIRSDVRYDLSRPVHERPDVLPEEIVNFGGAMLHYTYGDAGETFAKFRRYGEIEKLSGQDVAKNPKLYRIPIRVARRFIMENALKDGWPGVVTVAAEAYGDFCAALKHPSS
jgi:glycosyltransferase involved in cell wall biosynthesis